MAEAFDYAIDTLKFRLAVDNTAYSSTNQGRPYVRATAQFQKNQFDAAQTVGDQSLTGWWTRGQLSFHEGAGTKFYEVLDGQDVLNTYRQGVGVDVFTPGQATLTQDYASWLTSTNNWGPGGANLRDYTYLINPWTGEQKVITGTTAPTISDITLTGSTGHAVAVAADGNNYYVSTSAGEIYRFASSPSDSYSPDGAIYTGVGQMNQLFFAKNRLWGVDSGGKLYTFSPNPVPMPTTTAPTPVCTFPPTTGGSSDALVWTSIAATGSSIYVSRGGTSIYQVTISSDGSVPTLAAPVVVAELPKGESVRCMRSVLGYLVIATTSGIRVAQETSGGLVYGPQLVFSAKTNGLGSNCTHIGVIGQSAFVTATIADEDSPTGTTYDTLVEVNLAAPASSSEPLRFPWRELYRATPAATYTGVFETSGNDLFFFFGSTVYRTSWNDYRAASGTLVTGWHRFGTLDPKQFYSVTVRATGVGTVAVDWQPETATTGTWTPLGSWAFTTPGAVETFNFPLADLHERVRLRFTLTRQSTTDKAGPTLLGYQLKALPVPQRQRMIQVPLDVRDTVRLAGGTLSGRPGQGWSNLAALEALESSKAIVPFTDYRTKETGQAYIDSVEFYGDTLTSPQDRSFGGIAYVTLRVVS